MTITPAASPAASYPATFDIDAPEKVANWRVIANVFMAIPHLVILYGLQIMSEVIGLVSWFIILFTGKMPEGMANLQAMYFRYSVRTYSFVFFLREEYPPFAFGT